MIRQTEPDIPGFFLRLGYDPGRESEAFARLERGEIEPCRRALWSLVRGLEVPTSDAEVRQFVQLLLDVLQKLNRRMHRGRERQASYQAARVRLIERFSRTSASEPARRAFRQELQRLTETGTRPPSRSHRLASKARRFIESHYEERTSLSTVAEQLHVSSNYLSRVFRRETGMTLTSYIQRVRINHARRMLAAGGESISEIAYRVGYRNYRDFYRNFVKHENASPREVRERLSRAG